MIQSIHRSTSFAFPLASKIGHRPARAEFVVFAQKFTMHMEANPGCVCNDFRSGPSMPRRMSDERDQIIECNPPLHTCDERDSSYFRVRIVYYLRQPRNNSALMLACLSALNGKTYCPTDSFHLPSCGRTIAAVEPFHSAISNNDSFFLLIAV